MLQKFVIDKSDAKVVVLGQWSGLHSDMFEVKKWCDAEIEVQCANFVCILWEWLSIISVLKMDRCGLGILPQDVPGCARDTTKEDAFPPQVGFEFCRPLARAMHPHSAAKSSDVGENFLLMSSWGQWGLIIISSGRRCIQDSK